MARIKICGLMREQDIDAVNTALPDYIGFVFAKSKRQIDEAAAISLKNLLHPAIKAVGVFVNEDIGKIIRLCNLRVIDLIQLHGDENEDYIKMLKNHVPNKIIKAVRVRSLDDVERAVDFSSDHLLFDAYHEGIYGGLGKTFDWSLIHGVRKPFSWRAALIQQMQSRQLSNASLIALMSAVVWRQTDIKTLAKLKKL